MPWAVLKGQFGGGVNERFHFKQSFLRSMSLAAAVYSEAKVEVMPEGLLLKPSRPPDAPRLVPVGR